MATQTKYHHLTDRELLRMVEQNRAASPVIEELATRLEVAVALREWKEALEKAEDFTLCCPVCETKVLCFKDDNDNFDLRVAKG